MNKQYFRGSRIVEKIGDVKIKKAGHIIEKRLVFIKREPDENELLLSAITMRYSYTLRKFEPESY